MRQHRTVGVFTDYVGSYGRRLLQGVAAYAQTHANWTLFNLPLWSFAESPIVRTELDGVIADVFGSRMINLISGLKVPVINVCGDLEELPKPSMVPDDCALGKMGADFFLERGFRHFIYAGWLQLAYARKRGNAFTAEIIRRGFTCQTVHAPSEELSRALRDSTKPVAVLACNDTAGLDVLRSCHALGLSVPEQVAVLGMDNCDLINAMSRPPLASIEIPIRQAGYEAAALLERMMDGEAAPLDIIPIQPIGVIVRTSADVVAIGDPEVAESLCFIREHAAEPIRVQDVLAHVVMGRRTFERRFIKAMGRTPLQEIHRVRIERAKRLLIDTDLSMPEVSTRSGFGDDARFNVAFKRATGLAPSTYRRTLRLT